MRERGRILGDAAFAQVEFFGRRRDAPHAVLDRVRQPDTILADLRLEACRLERVDHEVARARLRRSPRDVWAVGECTREGLDARRIGLGDRTGLGRALGGRTLGGVAGHLLRLNRRHGRDQQTAGECRGEVS